MILVINRAGYIYRMLAFLMRHMMLLIRTDNSIITVIVNQCTQTLDFNYFHIQVNILK